MASRMVFEALHLLMPRDVPGIGKRRFGGVGDGGYVLLDRLDPAQAVMSFGIGPSVTFETELAECGHKVVMFDHTIDALPGNHPSFTWHRHGVAAQDDAEAGLFTLETLMSRLPVSSVEPILKMDVEGAEWDVLASVRPRVLARFTQITLEFHTLLDLDEPVFNARVQKALRALNEDFVPVHVHANNFGTRDWVGGFACAETIEVTYARRDLFASVSSTTFYPTPHDTPNFDEKPDYLLWFYPFLPGSENATFAG